MSELHRELYRHLEVHLRQHIDDRFPDWAALELIRGIRMAVTQPVHDQYWAIKLLVEREAYEQSV